MAKKEYDKRDYHQELTDKLIASIESAQKLNWEKPWFSAPSTRPFNLETGTRYSGCNLMATALSGFEDPRWLTFRGISSYAQKKDIELQLRKGSKGTPIFKAFAKEITEDKNFIFKASNAASRASNFQMEHLREHLYALNAQHTASPEQNNLLDSIGVPRGNQ
jgi:antirestriction protein ArdC